MVFANAGSYDYAHDGGTTWGRTGEGMGGDMGVRSKGREDLYHLRPKISSPTAQSPPPSPTMIYPMELQRLPHSPTADAQRPQTGVNLASVKPNPNLAHRPSLRKKLSVPSRLGQPKLREPPAANGTKQPSDQAPYSEPAVQPRRLWSGRMRSGSAGGQKPFSPPKSAPLPDERARAGGPQLPLSLRLTRVTRDRGASFTSQKPPPSQTKTQVPLRPANSVSDLGSGGLLQHRYRGQLSQSNHRSERAQSPRDGNFPALRREPPQRRPHDGRNDEELRASFRSALTTSSSYIGSGTERSSVATKSSSTSEFYANRSSGAQGLEADTTDEGMSVDDAIGMYVGGFHDDDDGGDSNGEEGGKTNEQDTHSRLLAGTMDGAMGDPPKPESPVQPDVSYTAAARPSTNSTTDVPPRSPSHPAPPMAEPRDRYGFRKVTQHVTLEQYEVWNTQYTENLHRRRRKWTVLLKESGLPTENPLRFPPKSAKTKRYVRKGIPPEWRGAAWFWYGGGYARMQKHPGLYSELVGKAERGEINEGDVELIERDLNRTFPDNIRFKPDLPPPTKDGVHNEKQSGEEHHQETEIVKSLRRVLQAFSIHAPRIGYCQSLNFLAGLLLLFMEEEKAFWMLNIITQVYLPGTHEVNLEGANVDLGVLMTSVRESLPAVWAKIGGELDGGTNPDNEGRGNGAPLSTRLPPITLCTTAWFMSCFIGTLPIETVLRVWDSFFFEGSKILFRVALAIFKVGEPQIRAVSDPMEIFQVVQTIPRRLVDASALMEVCFKRRNGFGHISQETIDARRLERRGLYAEERRRVAAAAAASAAGDAQPPPDPPGKEVGVRGMLRRADSRVFRRTQGRR
ncbi:hypothetical protein GP486_003877 [Trichoglossum hirsutum]|uniref:Rab-GAP TBC domain-containing protein n=1 Tax=Trichoglossum hirsutum TaxID=265104 RepID=A0A9P8RQ16_9PEZI|nr:hypothetical protein GP486_003877 [Trichoglossum hirsutum]